MGGLIKYIIAVGMIFFILTAIDISNKNPEASIKDIISKIYNEPVKK